MKNIFKKIISLVLVVMGVFFLTSCEKEATIILHTFGSEYLEVSEKANTEYTLPEISNRRGFIFVGWYDNLECTGEPITSVKVADNVQVYAKWQKIEEYSIVYISNVTGEEQVSIAYPYLPGYDYQFLQEQPFTFRSRSIAGYSFAPNGDVNVVDSITDNQVYHYADTMGIVRLYVVWEGPYEIEYRSTNDIYLDKFAMRSAYFTDFYSFIIAQEGGKEHLEKYNIHSAADFVNLASDWRGAGGNELTGIGNVAGSYYLKIEVGGKLEDQPTTHFIGYCYQNNKWVELIEFLIVFFAYWRTDEGYTGGPSDPNNTGNDFFASAWAALVDTGKMFYFTSATLTDKYPWFTKERSERVHHALDNVPGCLNLQTLPHVIDDKDITLPTPVAEGYTFVGWYDNDEGIGNAIKVLKADKIKEEIVVYAVWEKNK